MGQLGIDPMQADIEAHYRWIEAVAARCVHDVDELAAMGNEPPDVLTHEPPSRTLTVSERVDCILIHKVWGLIIFAADHGQRCSSASSGWPRPIMDAHRRRPSTGSARWSPSRMADGPAQGADRRWHLRRRRRGGRLRAADRACCSCSSRSSKTAAISPAPRSSWTACSPASACTARASSRCSPRFACAIPGIMATRTIENRKDRLATILIAPFMSCSARLPVYTLLIGAFFAAVRRRWPRPASCSALYALGIVAAAELRLALQALAPARPHPGVHPGAAHLQAPAALAGRPPGAGPTPGSSSAAPARIIFCMSVLLWAMTYYPRLPETQVQRDPRHRHSCRTSTRPPPTNRLAAAQRDHSIAGRLGHAIEPVIRPLGYDWKIGVGLIGAFAAREVFVSTMAITYAAGDEDSRHSPTPCAPTPTPPATAPSPANPSGRR